MTVEKKNKSGRVKSIRVALMESVNLTRLWIKKKSSISHKKTRKSKAFIEQI